MLQFPTLMTQFPSSTKTIPASYLLPLQWPQPQNEEILLAMEEAEFEEKVASFFFIYVFVLLRNLLNRKFSVFDCHYRQHKRSILDL